MPRPALVNEERRMDGREGRGRGWETWPAGNSANHRGQRRSCEVRVRQQWMCCLLWFVGADQRAAASL